jgi:hypothetical protein
MEVRMRDCLERPVAIVLLDEDRIRLECLCDVLALRVIDGPSVAASSA